jgi:triosephosphate isomerase
MIPIARPLLVGNWKMNRTQAESVAHIAELRALVAGLPLDIIVMPPTLALAAAVDAAEGSNIHVGAQNSFFADSGPFTGEVSVPMLRAVGVNYVLVGHSERRRLFCETDEIVNLKVAAAILHGAQPIVCVGETLHEKESGTGEARIADQVAAVFDGISPDFAARIVVAYEPVWAVGTGTAPSASDANVILATVREIISAHYDKNVSQSVQLLYGGGVTPENAAQFASQTEINGVLVGAATASAIGFAGIARSLVNP